MVKMHTQIQELMCGDVYQQTNQRPQVKGHTPTKIQKPHTPWTYDLDKSGI